MRNRRVLIIVFLAVVLLGGLTYLAQGPGFPQEIILFTGEELNLEHFWPLPVEIRSSKDTEILINGKPVSKDFKPFTLTGSFSILAESREQVSLEFRFLRIINPREMLVNVLPSLEVYPGGQAIGVLLNSQGVMVVDISHVETPQGEKIFPAREAGLDKGDIIIAVDGREIENKDDVAKLVESSKGLPLELIVLKAENRKQEEKIEIQPQKSHEGKYMIGIYINDGVAGVGTLTFYEKETMNYGALGHIITEAHTRLPVMGHGEIVEARISGINAGQAGIPGEKFGTFYYDESPLGTIAKNTPFGIYGKLYEGLKNNHFQSPVPVASASQAKKGKASIYTVISDKEIEKFEVKIERVVRQIKPAHKGLVFRVVDSDLLEITGGIVQGMSGSPIVQDGRLIGAVTHVFINDPERGYGIMAEWMLREAGLFAELEKDAG